MDYFASVSPCTQGPSLPYNPCQLLDFCYLSLQDGETYQNHSGEREILAVILGGRANFSINGHSFSHVGGRPTVFAGKPHSVYIPYGADYQIAAAGPVEIALVSAPSDMPATPYIIPPDRVVRGIWGAANFKRYYHQILTQTSQGDLPARRLIVGETFTPSGNWSTYPPHKHEVDHLPQEAFHEEMYFFKVSPVDGFGIARYYNDKGIEANFTVRDNTILMIPDGYHTVVSAPGCTTYYLWVLAGEHRTQAVVEDSSLAWVSRTVPMLRELGA